MLAVLAFASPVDARTNLADAVPEADRAVLGGETLAVGGFGGLDVDDGRDATFVDLGTVAGNFAVRVVARAIIGLTGVPVAVGVVSVR